MKPLLILAGLIYFYSSLAFGSSLIVDGRDAKTGEYPAVINLDIFVGSNYRLCTGTYLSPNTILTAAHCVFDPASEIILPDGVSATVVIPDAYRNFKEQEKQGLLGTEILRIASDLALLVLNKNVSKFTMPYHTKPQVGLATIVGYGGKNLLTRSQLNQSNDPTLGTKRIGTLEIERIFPTGRIDSSDEIYEARHWYNWIDMISASGSHQALSTRGDSGGPLLQKGKVIGVISGTDTSNQDDTHVYSSKTYFAGLYSSDFKEIREKAKKIGSSIQ